MGSLTPEQVEHYRREGYVVLPPVLEPEEIESYKRRATEIVNGDLPEEAANRIVKDIAFAKGQLPMPVDPEHAVWKIINPDRFDPLFKEALRFPKVLSAVESLIGKDLIAFLLMFIYKPPGLAESVHPFHQDAAYFMFGPQDQCLGVWIALDPVSEANGSLTIVPRSHTFPVSHHAAKEGINFGALEAEGIEGNPEYHNQAIAMAMNPGECLLFNTRLFHRSGGNRTEEHRRVITLHMASSQCKLTGPALSEYGFTLVQGKTYQGGLEPVKDPEMALKNEFVDRLARGRELAGRES